ncbi:hypothetical protein QBC39DRAFT_402764 [Podospora conica]|nr:hypothetical protein QBC39DRAFT_402764 [Schizothecium conicum]
MHPRFGLSRFNLFSPPSRSPNPNVLLCQNNTQPCRQQLHLRWLRKATGCSPKLYNLSHTFLFPTTSPRCIVGRNDRGSRVCTGAASGPLLNPRKTTTFLPLHTTTTTMAQPHHTAGTPPSSPSDLSLFETLPFDVVYEICSYLDYLSVLNISMANSRLHKSILPDLFVPASTKIAFLQLAEKFPQNRYSLACFRCLKVLPRLAFSDAHRSGHKGKNSSRPFKQLQRFCYDCGVSNLLFQHCQGFWHNGFVHMVCHLCKRGIPTHNESIYDYMTCSCKPPQNPVPSRRPPKPIPPHLHASLLARFLRRTGHLYGLKLELPGGALALRCFGCFRLRHSDYDFTTHQSETEQPWRRRCRKCLDRFYGSGRDTEEGRAARERFHAQELCLAYGHVMVRGEQCRGCVWVARSMDLVARALDNGWPMRKLFWEGGSGGRGADAEEEGSGEGGAGRGWVRGTLGLEGHAAKSIAWTPTRDIFMACTL